MPNVMSTGLSGLLAMQRALDTTSQNIANATTEGYVRQRVELRTRVSVPVGTNWVGNGVEVGAVVRQVNQYLVDQSRAGTSSAARLEVMSAESSRIANLVGDPSTGLSVTLQGLENAFQGVATEPSSLAARQSLLGEARNVVERLQGFDARLSAMDREINLRLRTDASEINRIGAALAKLNKEISANYAASADAPNGLLDQRDRLLDELSGKVNVNTVPQERGVVNVFIGSGQALVVGESAATITTESDPFEPTRPRIMLQGDEGISDVTSFMRGGSVGGLLDFRSQVLDPTRNELGRIAAGLAEAVNGQHASGLDMRGSQGGDFFAVGGPWVLPASGNAGTATFESQIDSAGALTGADYELEYSGSAWTLRRLDSGASVPMTGTGTAADPLRADGFALTLSGTPAAGDRFQVQPTRNVVRGLGVAVSDPARVAAAAPIVAEAASSNLGGARVTRGEVVDAASPTLRDPVTLVFTTPTTYSVDGAGNYPFTSDQPIEVNGWRITISGTPASGDSFTVRDNAGAVGDNRNALALASGLGSGLLDGGGLSVGDAARGLATEVGITARQSGSSLEAEALMRDEAIEQRRSVSGVNLDEEAANLLRYQQAYQAAAQLVRVANEMFQTLLDSTR